MQFPTKEVLLKELHLGPHSEAGYFVDTYASPHRLSREGKTERVVSSIFYMLTKEFPMSHFHIITSDIVHYYHCGLPLKYHVVTPDGECNTTVMGHDIAAGQKLQLTVPAGCWKAAELVTDIEGGGGLDYSLLSEAVTPEFCYENWRMATEKDIKALILPEKWDYMKRFVCGTNN